MVERPTFPYVLCRANLTKGEWRIMQSGNHRDRQHLQTSGTGIPTFPLCRPSLSGSCILAFLLSHGYSLTPTHPLAFSCSPIIYSSCSFLTIFQARDPWSILWELLIEELVGRYTLPPLHASYRGKTAVSIEVASSSSGRLWQCLSRKNVNPPLLSPLDQHKQGPEDSRLHSINVVVDLLAKDDRRATVSCQNHPCISARPRSQTL